MKKLVVFIAIATLAICVKAASTDWTVTAGNLKDKNGSAFAGTFELYATGGDLSSDLLVLSVNPSLATYNKYAFTVDDGLTAEVKYNFYYVLKDSNGTLTSQLKENITALGTGSQTIGVGNQATYTSTAGNWGPVPEPTSALLLMLGVAGLALKRKRV